MYPGVKLYVTFRELGTWDLDTVESVGGFDGEWDVVSATLDAFGVVLNLLEGFPFAPPARFGEVWGWMEKKWPAHLMDSIAICYDAGNEVKARERKAA
jgi:hypothetical protein